VIPQVISGFGIEEECGGGDEVVFDSIASGTSTPFAGYEDSTVRAAALMYRTAEGNTIVQLSAVGLDANTQYPAHVHALPCRSNNAGGHYKLDPTVEGTEEANEIWPTLTSNGDGVARTEVSLEGHVARPDAQSIVIHDPNADNAKMVCADLHVSFASEPSAQAIDPGRVSDAAALGEAEPNKDNAAISPSEKANVGQVQPSTVGNRDLYQRLVGEEVTLSLDIDGDGENEELYIFVPADFESPTFVIWDEGDVCNLAWKEITGGGVAWHISVTCSGDLDGAVICQSDNGQRSCSQCTLVDCIDCMIESNGVFCIPPEPKKNGDFSAFASANEADQTIGGTAELTIGDNTTLVVTVSGLDPNQAYASHVHALPCEVNNAGEHYKRDGAVEETLEDNEIWPSVTPDSDGNATDTVVLEGFPSY
jgi:hypothetical protein